MRDNTTHLKFMLVKVKSIIAHSSDTEVSMALNVCSLVQIEGSFKCHNMGKLKLGNDSAYAFIKLDDIAGEMGSFRQ